ncbi:MAG: hypothetical protein WB646_04560 [Steroidobacteraceae bacterium]
MDAQSYWHRSLDGGGNRGASETDFNHSLKQRVGNVARADSYFKLHFTWCRRDLFTTSARHAEETSRIGSAVGQNLKSR